MSDSSMPIMKKSQGLTLLELIIASFMSTLILSAITGVYLAAHNHFCLQHELSRIQENARIAIYLLNADLQSAGYIGCAKLTDDFPIKNFPPFFISKDNAISSQKTAHEDNIITRHADIFHANLISIKQNVVLYTTDIPRFHFGDVLFISNCKRAEIFKVQYVTFQNNQQKIVAMRPLSGEYSPNSEISRWVENSYFIKKTKRHKENGEFIYSLYVKDINENVTELIEGVEHFKARFSILENGLLVEREAINSSSNLKGVSIALTFSSIDGPSLLKKTWYSYVALQ